MTKLIILLFCLSLLACATPSKGYVEATNQALEVIVPQYIQYLEADTKLKDFDKKARTQASREVLELSREELKRVNKK